MGIKCTSRTCTLSRQNIFSPFLFVIFCQWLSSISCQLFFLSIRCIMSTIEIDSDQRQVSISAYIIGWSMSRSLDTRETQILNFVPNDLGHSNPELLQNYRPVLV